MLQLLSLGVSLGVDGLPNVSVRNNQCLKNAKKKWIVASREPYNCQINVTIVIHVLEYGNPTEC